MCVGQHQGVMFPMLNHGDVRVTATVVRVGIKVLQRKPRTDRSLRDWEVGCAKTQRELSCVGSQQRSWRNEKSSHEASRTVWKRFISHQCRGVAL